MNYVWFVIRNGFFLLSFDSPGCYATCCGGCTFLFEVVLWKSYKIRFYDRWKCIMYGVNFEGRFLICCNIGVLHYLHTNLTSDLSNTNVAEVF